jgi:acyl-CoA thioesterase-1
MSEKKPLVLGEPTLRHRRSVFAAGISLIAISVGSGVGLTPARPAQASEPANATSQPARTTQAAQAARVRNLLVLGDSLSAEYGLARGSGWVALLERRLSDKGGRYAVVNASISGETTAGGRSRIEELLARHRPAVVIVELGGNDALRGLDLAATERNLREIARLSRRAGARVLILGMMVPPNYGRRYGEQFSGLFARVAADEKASLVPFFLDGVAERIELFQPDRIHPTAQAQPIMLENVWPALERLL